MLILACLRFVLLLTAATTTEAFQWTPSNLLNGANKTVCGGSDVSLDWSYNKASDERIVNTEWYFIPHGGEEVLLGSFVHGFFLPETSTPVAIERIDRNDSAGITLKNVSYANSGNYTVRVNVQRGSITNTTTQLAVLTVNEVPSVKNDELVVDLHKPDNQAATGDSQQLQMQLSCGIFESLGHPAVTNNYVIWTTASGHKFNSTSHDGELFYFTLTNNTKEENYTCSLNRDALPEVCRNASQPLSYTYVINEDSVKLSNVEMRLKQVEEQLRQEQLTREEEVKHVNQTLNARIDQLEAMFAQLKQGSSQNPTAVPKEETLPTSCEDARENSATTGVVSVLFPWESSPRDVFCDQDTAGGGWLVIQRRVDGSVHFNRSWTEYEQGFGNLTTNFWIGLTTLHSLTTAKTMSLRVDLWDFDQQQAFAAYDTFRVGGSSDDYRMTVGGYSGTAGNALSSGGHQFTTYDRDNDDRTDQNCASAFLGGWWYSACGYANPNGVYKARGGQGVDSIHWFDWKRHEALAKVEMKIRSRG